MIVMLAMAMAAAAGSAGPDAVEGRWRTAIHNGIVEIRRCGPSICGRLIVSDKLRADPSLKDANNPDPKLRSRALKDLLILSGFQSQSGAWAGGQIYNAEDGKTYDAKVTLLGLDKLSVRGCVFFPLCKTQIWTRMH